MTKWLVLSLLVARVASADGLTDYGFDPGLVVHRIATASATTRYWESCADGPCSALSAGSGFHTLGGGTGDAVVPDCIVNSGGSCPWWFVWDGPAAALGLSTLPPAERPNTNVYLALQDNLKNPSSPYKFGSFDHPPLSSAATSMLLAAQLNGGSGSARVLTGIVWQTPGRAYVLEMNLDSVGFYSSSFWSTTTRIAYVSGCSGAVCAHYLGARAWKQASLLGTSRRRLFVDWSAIVQSLVASGDLPQSAFGPYVTDAFYTGQEVVGQASVGVQIEDRHIYGVTHSPTGWIEAGGETAHGWGFSWNNATAPLSVDIYRDGPFGVGTKVATVVASDPSPDLVAKGYPGAHRWHTSLAPNVTYFAYGLDPVTGERQVLSGSGKR